VLSKEYCFKISSYIQAKEILDICYKKKIEPIFFINHNLAVGLGSSWLKELINMLNNEFGNKNFKIYVDTKKNYGLFLDLIDKKIDYLGVKANKILIKKLSELAKLNRVLINPDFSIVDISKIKNIISKL